MDEPDAFDRACEFDSTGHPDLAVPLYREALEQGLEGENRRRAVIQMAALPAVARELRRGPRLTCDH